MQPLTRAWHDRQRIDASMNNTRRGQCGTV